MAIFERLREFAEHLYKGPLDMPQFIAIPHERCAPKGSAGAKIEAEAQYFAVTINEMYLSDARFGASTYAPMVVATTTFLYGDKTMSVPYVVGPNLLKQKERRLPRGLVIQDTLVAGLYPYRGKPIAISIVLYRLRQQDYAKNLLRLVESVAGAIGPAADLGVLAKVGDALIDGLEDLLGLGDTEPVAGGRIELSPWDEGGIVSGYSALVAGGAKLDPASLSVEGGRLRRIDDGGAPKSFDDADYVLYSLRSVARRDDLRELPFYPLYERAMTNAANGGAEHWDAAKSTFGEVWQQMLVSPDLIRAQADELRGKWEKELVDAHKSRSDIGKMSGPTAPKVRSGARVFEVAGVSSILTL